MQRDMHRVVKTAGLALACSLFAWGQSETSAGVPAQMIVTAGHYYSHVPPLITSQDLVVTQQYEPAKITNLVPLRGELAALELYVLVDDCASCEAGTKSTSCAGSSFLNRRRPPWAWLTFRAGSSKSSRSRDR